MSDELSLIECATLSASAVSRSPGNNQVSYSTDEDSLIANAILSNSETIGEISKQQNEYPHKSSPTGHERNSPNNTPKKGSITQSEDDVFEDADKDYSKTLFGPLKIKPSPRIDERKGQVTENVLINYANLSENELEEMERKREEKEYSQQYMDNYDPNVPKLDIATISEENDYDDYDDNDDGEKAGCITPVNSLADLDSRKQSLVGRSPRSKGVSPRVRFVDDDHEAQDADFNALVIDTANAMNEVDFEEMKQSFRDTEGFGIFLRYDSPILFLKNLCRYRLISPDNLHHLQGILARLQNPLLHMRARQYMKHKLQMVYFYPDTRHIPLGFGDFKCHISGKDFTRLKRHDLETLRSTVSLLLFIPSSSVYITGIEPGINLVVSLMVPQRYIGVLMKMASDGLPELVIAGVDLVKISGRTFKTHAQISSLTSAGDHMRFLTVYQQLRAKDQHIHEQAREIAALKEDAEFVKLELETKTAEMQMFGERSPRGRIPRRHRSADRSPRPLDRSFQKLLNNRKTKQISYNSTDVSIVVADTDSDRGNTRALTGTKQTDITEHKESMSSNTEDFFRLEKNNDPGLQWTRGDLPTLSRVRQIIERGEIMSEIETLLTELGVPRAQDDLVEEI